jgi:hypothetical protein
VGQNPHRASLGIAQGDGIVTKVSRLPI